MRYNQPIPRARRPRTNNPALLAKYESKGIYFDHGDTVILDHPDEFSSLRGMDSNLIRGMDADTPVYNISSTGVPFQFLTEYAKKPIKQILMKKEFFFLVMIGNVRVNPNGPFIRQKN
jgi:hypothetical protein